MDMNNKKFVAELAVNPVNPARPWECTWCVAIDSKGCPLLCGKSYTGKKHLQSHVSQTHKKRKDKAGSAGTAGHNLVDETDNVNSADGAGTKAEGSRIDGGGRVEGRQPRSKGHIDEERFPPLPASVRLPQAAFLPPPAPVRLPQPAYLPKFGHYKKFLQPPSAAPVQNPPAVFPPNFGYHGNFPQQPLAAPRRNPPAVFPPNFGHHENFPQPPAAPVQNPPAVLPRNFGHHEKSLQPPPAAPRRIPPAVFPPNFGHHENFPQQPPAPIRNPPAVFPPSFGHHENFPQQPPAPIRNPPAVFPPSFGHHENFPQPPPPAAPVQNPQAVYPNDFQFAPMPYVNVQPPPVLNSIHLGDHPFDPQIYNRPGSNEPYSCILCYPRRCFCGMAGIPGYGVPGPRAFASGGARFGGYRVRGAGVGGQYYR